MKFTEDKKEKIMNYMLEKIDRGDDAITRSVSDNFNVNRDTIYAYLNELIDQGIVNKKKRGSYELKKCEYTYHMSRNDPGFDNDTYAYTHFLYPHLEKYEKNVQQIWAYVFEEMTNNVIDHSEASDIDIHIIQSYTRTRVILADNGIGIFKKIQGFFGLASIAEAIAELFKGKVTTDSVNHSGEGIFFSSRIMDAFYIVSGNNVFACNRYDDDFVTETASTGFDGTCVIMELSNHTKKNAKDVFDAYSDEEDYSFYKTQIPVKNMFDSDPVSRSQAKRLYSRLEKFREIIVDFDGVGWIGQGFAHQLFVVWANEHPDICIKPINMEPDVAKMYYHVRNS